LLLLKHFEDYASHFLFLSSTVGLGFPINRFQQRKAQEIKFCLDVSPFEEATFIVSIAQRKARDAWALCLRIPEEASLADSKLRIYFI
ncbi:hypothetical protein Tco_1157933, partial [Tanacetum coccineum]